MHQASNDGNQYDIKGAGGGGGTHSASAASEQEVATVFFFELVNCFFFISFFFSCAFPAPDVEAAVERLVSVGWHGLSDGVIPPAMSTGAAGEGGRGSLGSFIWAAISDSNNER
jgi:hypothetical protein